MLNTDEAINQLFYIRNEIRATMKEIEKDMRTPNSLRKITHLMRARQHLYEVQLELERYDKIWCREEDPDGDL